MIDHAGQAAVPRARSDRLAVARSMSSDDRSGAALGSRLSFPTVTLTF
ncbi:hypothetical protein NJ7G_0026 [Natrinema sp. J7-2]|uniref:Uncharacterized protein n=1 Tax=Natrinema gari JCM 14663 TaxID=1230459 RepID=L9YZB0_9EURY|nr:hypothetical protein NJ7G_0026 [Natrinema sp. J7-2]ELY79444.1 hypothetical protein C486_10604 [Natrinema gari JCM 14663]